MKLFSPFFLLMGGLVLSPQANAQAGPPVVGTPAREFISSSAVAAATSHSSQLPQEERQLAQMPATTAQTETAGAIVACSTGIAAVAASKSQLLLVLLETIQDQQAQLNALQAETAAATHRVNRDEAVIAAFEQRLRQLEAAGSRPSFWR